MYYLENSFFFFFFFSIVPLGASLQAVVKKWIVI